TRSWNQPGYVFQKLWGRVTVLRNLRTALARVARDRGRRTAGVDGLTVAQLMAGGADTFLAELRAEMRARAFRPSPARRVLIPKPGQPGKHLIGDNYSCRSATTTFAGPSRPDNVVRASRSTSSGLLPVLAEPGWCATGRSGC